MTYESMPHGYSGAQPGRASGDRHPSLQQEALPGNSELWTPPPDPGCDRLRLVAIGSLYAINNCRDSLHALGYARPDEWSWPLPFVSADIIRTATPGEMMRILTKRIRRSP